MQRTRRSGATISAETASKLRDIIASHDAARAKLDRATASCQALIDGSNQQDMEKRLTRQWAHAPVQ